VLHEQRDACSTKRLYLTRAFAETLPRYLAVTLGGQRVEAHHRRRLGSPIALALLALSPPSILVRFDGSRFAARALDTRVEITKQYVRPFFSKAQLVRP